MPWLGLGVQLPLAFACGLVGQGLTLRLFGPRASWTEVHWSERARRAWAAQITLALSAYLLILLWGVFSGTLLHGQLSGLGRGAQGLLVGMAALLGVTLAGRSGRSAWERHAGLVRDPGGTWTWVLISRGHLLLFLLIASLAPSRLGLPLLALAVLVASLSLLWHRGFGLRLAGLLGRLEEPSPELTALVARCAAEVGVAPRRLVVLRWARANAFVFPSSGALCFTTGALAVLDDREQYAVCAHELGHLAEGPRVQRLRQAQSLALVPLVAAKAVSATWGMGAGFALGAVVVVLLVPGQRWRRRLESQADAVAHRHAGEADEAVYARALERLYAYNLAPAVMGGGRTHPDLYDRMIAAGTTPDFPRPKPPNRWPGRLWVAVLAGGLVVGCVAVKLVLDGVARARTPVEEAMLLPMAIVGGDGAFEALGYEADAREDWWRADRFWIAAARLEPGDLALQASAAMARAREGDCQSGRFMVEGLAFGPRRVERDPSGNEPFWFQALEDTVSACEEHGAMVHPPGPRAAP